MKSHLLKCDAVPFEALWSGAKTFEWRKNDREFAKGDLLTLEEMENGERTGRRIVASVTWILRGPDYGVPPGYCVMSLGAMRRSG